jgi:hypothetical protein
MKNETFEDYLQEYFAENLAITDDVDCYVDWVSNLEPDEVMELAEKAIRYYRKQLLKELQTN